MPIFTLFFSLILAAIVGIILTSLYSVNGLAPTWVHQVFLSIVGTGVITSAITKDQICKLCSFIKIKRLKICKCQHA